MYPDKVGGQVSIYTSAFQAGSVVVYETHSPHKRIASVLISHLVAGSMKAGRAHDGMAIERDDGRCCQCATEWRDLWASFGRRSAKRKEDTVTADPLTWGMAPMSSGTRTRVLTTCGCYEGLPGPSRRLRLGLTGRDIVVVVFCYVNSPVHVGSEGCRRLPVGLPYVSERSGGEGLRKGKKHTKVEKEQYHNHLRAASTTLLNRRDQYHQYSYRTIPRRGEFVGQHLDAMLRLVLTDMSFCRQADGNASPPYRRCEK